MIGGILATRYGVSMHAHRGYRIGGSSESEQSSESLDMRVVGGDDSTNTSTKVAGDGNIVTFTDHAAVNGALNLALKGVEGANATTKLAIQSSGGILDGALKMASEQQQAFTDTVKDIKTSDVRVLVIAGLAVVGLAASVFLKKAI